MSSEASAGSSPMVWRETFPVRLIEIDAHGTLAAGALCDYLQEAAGNHAGALGLSVWDLRERHLTWVLSRLRLRVERLPAVGERLEVRTWPTGAERLFALRDFEVVDAQGCRVAAAVSAWLIIDVAARRPVRIQSVFEPPGAGVAVRALDADIEKVPALEGGERHDPRETPVVVRLADLDANEHANNARIAEWVVEGVGRGVWQRSVLRELDIDFLAEAFHGDTLASRCRSVGEGYCLHSVVRREDGREIARARTRWGPLDPTNRNTGE